MYSKQRMHINTSRSCKLSRVMNVVKTYIGLAVFFFRKVFTLNFFFRGLTCDFLSSVHFYCLKEGKPTMEQQKCKGHEKRDRLLISKMEINYQISQRNKSFTY